MTIRAFLFFSNTVVKKDIFFCNGEICLSDRLVQFELDFFPLMLVACEPATDDNFLQGQYYDMSFAWVFIRLIAGNMEYRYKRELIYNLQYYAPWQSHNFYLSNLRNIQYKSYKSTKIMPYKSSEKERGFTFALQNEGQLTHVSFSGENEKQNIPFNVIIKKCGFIDLKKIMLLRMLQSYNI